MVTSRLVEWRIPPHLLDASSTPAPVCPGCGHDEHDGTCPVHRRKLDPCACRGFRDVPGVRFTKETSR